MAKHPVWHQKLKLLINSGLSKKYITNEVNKQKPVFLDITISAVQPYHYPSLRVIKLAASVRFVKQAR